MCKCCCSKHESDKPQDRFTQHWDKIYTDSPHENLGWYETDHTPTLDMISRTGLSKSDRFLLVGAGSTTLIDELLKQGYSALIASDLSPVALNKLENRLGKGKAEIIVDDLTDPINLPNIAAVDMWIDRAVLHFLTEKKDQDTYFELLREMVSPKGYALLVEYDLSGAEKCVGLPVHRYSKEMLIEKLEPHFDLVHNFDHIYLNPSGNEKSYIYTLFRKR